jgi:Tol biopolymer transport system component
LTARTATPTIHVGRTSAGREVRMRSTRIGPTIDLKRTVVALAILPALATPAHGQAPPWAFERHADVGKVAHGGATSFDAERREFRVTGGGANIWNREDAFHFAWRETSGDLTAAASVSFEGSGGDPHRKAGWMVREGLAPDAPYADVAVHGDGLIELQYRQLRGGVTKGIRTPVKSPATVRLERTGDVFTLFVAPPGGAFQTVGSISVALRDPVAVGLYACAHDDAATETAVIKSVEFTNPATAAAGAKRVRESSLEILDVDTGARRLVHRARVHFEAPNWSRDGKTLIVNGSGGLFTIPVDGGTLAPLEIGALRRCNNDHGLSPDGRWLAVSAQDGGPSRVFVLPSAGGEPRLVTPKGPSYWHGWSPDGKTLAYCAQRDGAFDVYTIPVDGGPETRLTDAPGLDDGPEYAPDGRTIFWNSERSGVMRIWRMRPDGSQQEPMTNDAEYADWFPHPSPDGRRLLFLSYASNVKGHPPDEDVVLRMATLPDGKPRVVASLFGGQGTINVPSWSPDGKSVAFVSYRLVLP